MLKCCKNNYAICDEFVGCPESLIIKVPTSYPIEDIIIRLFKNRKMAYDVAGVIDGGGFVTISTNDLPDGFLNPYGAVYSIQFVLFVSGEVYEFTIDGEVYDAIDFELMVGEAFAQSFIINIF